MVVSQCYAYASWNFSGKLNEVAFSLDCSAPYVTNATHMNKADWVHGVTLKVMIFYVLKSLSQITFHQSVSQIYKLESVAHWTSTIKSPTFYSADPLLNHIVYTWFSILPHNITTTLACLDNSIPLCWYGLVTSACMCQGLRCPWLLNYQVLSLLLFFYSYRSAPPIFIIWCVLYKPVLVC